MAGHRRDHPAAHRDRHLPGDVLLHRWRFGQPDHDGQAAQPVLHPHHPQPPPPAAAPGALADRSVRRGVHHLRRPARDDELRSGRAPSRRHRLERHRQGSRVRRGSGFLHQCLRQVRQGHRPQFRRQLPQGRPGPRLQEPQVAGHAGRRPQAQRPDPSPQPQAGPRPRRSAEGPPRPEAVRQRPDPLARPRTRHLPGRSAVLPEQPRAVAEQPDPALQLRSAGSAGRPLRAQGHGRLPRRRIRRGPGGDPDQGCLRR